MGYSLYFHQYINKLLSALSLILVVVIFSSVCINLIKTPNFFIPGVSPKYYAQNTVIPILTYGLFSPDKHPNEPISYKTIPVCKPLQGWSIENPTLGEILKHEEILQTFYEIIVGINITDPTLDICSIYLSLNKYIRFNEVKPVYKAIQGDYRYIFTLDGIEVLYPEMNALDRYHVFGDTIINPLPNWPNTMIPTITYENITIESSVSTNDENTTTSEEYDSNLDMFETDDNMHIVIDNSNAYQFPIIPTDILQKTKTTVGLPIGFTVSKTNDPRGPRGYYMYQHYNFYIYYTETNIKVSSNDEIWKTLSNEERLQGNADVVSILRFEGYPDPRSAILVIPANGNLTLIPDTIKTTYGYVWLHDDSNWVSRWTSILYSSKTRVDAMAIVDIVTSSVMGGLIFLFVVFLWWHISRSMKYKISDFIHNQDRNWLFHFDATQWRHLGIDFFRPPIFTSFAILLMAIGVQCGSSVIITLMAGCIGLFFGNFRGGLDETIFIVYMLMYTIGGIVSGFFNCTWSRSRYGAKNATLFFILSWFLFPSIPIWFFIFSTMSLHFLVGTPFPSLRYFFDSISLWIFITIILQSFGILVGIDLSAPNSKIRYVMKKILFVLCIGKYFSNNKDSRQSKTIASNEILFTDLGNESEKVIIEMEEQNPSPQEYNEKDSGNENISTINQDIKEGIEKIFEDIDNSIKKVTDNIEYTQKMVNNDIPMTMISSPPVPIIQLEPRPFHPEIDEEFVSIQRKFYDRWKDDVLTNDKIEHKTIFIPKLWAKTKWLWTFMFGIISYGMIFISINTFLRSSWGSYQDTLYFTTLLNLLTWCVFVVICSNMFVYIHLNNRDWRWFWPCFHFSGSCAIYYFIHTMFYLILSGMTGIVTIIYFTLFSILTTLAMYISIGSISCIITYFVFRRLYNSAVSKDD